jgi:thioredoxin-related protein
MRLVLSAAVAGLIVALASFGSGSAAVDLAKPGSARMELVIFEHPDCTYCQVFRARVVPRYMNSDHANEAPLRFIDIATTGANTGARGVTLNGPITMVPTAVLVKQGREVDRIPGYWAPDNFFKMVSFLISKAE